MLEGQGPTQSSRLTYRLAAVVMYLDGHDFDLLNLCAQRRAVQPTVWYF